jgi:hypothetical protein
VENNPEQYRDPDGKNSEIVYIYAGHTRYLGAHAFILITPNVGQDSLQIPGHIGQQQLTISAEPTGTFYAPGALQLQINNSDNSVPSSQYLARDPIFAPLGVTQQQYDQGLVRLAKTKIANGGILDPHYNGLGIPQIVGGSNSNNAATSLINQSGGFFAPVSFPGGKYAWAAGIGTTVATPSVVSRILSAVAQLAAAFAVRK